MIYLDNAATTFPKPPAVRREVERCLREYCGNPGRSAHKLSLAAAEAIYDCRLAAAELFGIPSPEKIIFTYNTTYALNMAIKGLLRRGDHVLISDMEHNAVFRPVHRLAELGEISYDIFPTGCADPHGVTENILSAIRRLLRPNTRMLITAHIPNLCSAVMPLDSSAVVPFSLILTLVSTQSMLSQTCGWSGLSRINVTLSIGHRYGAGITSAVNGRYE